MSRKRVDNIMEQLNANFVEEVRASESRPVVIWNLRADGLMVRREQFCCIYVNDVNIVMAFSLIVNQDGLTPISVT